MRTSHVLESAVERYARATVEAIQPPTREEAGTLRGEVLRACLLALVDDQSTQLEAERKRIDARLRMLGRVEAALKLVDPMQAVEDHERTDDRREGQPAG